MDGTIKVILVEDDHDLRESLASYLRLEGYCVTSISTGLQYYQELSANTFTIAIIGIGLPDQSGLILAEYTRKNTCISIIILTSQNILKTRIDSYNKGCDLFLSKPVDYQELNAAIKSLVTRQNEKMLSFGELSKRNSPSSLESQKELEDTEQFHQFYTVGKLRVDGRTREVLWGTKPLNITKTEFDILYCLLKEKPNVVTYKDMQLKIFHYSESTKTKTIVTHIANIRKKISVEGDPLIAIKAVTRVGYKLIEK